MSTTVILNGLSYSIPAEGDANWGLNVSNYLIAIASACLQKTGGTYTLTAEVDFGATYGLKLSYVKSRAANPSSAGIFRLGNNESIGWRNAANTGDLLLKATTGDKLEFNGINVPLTGSIVDADISASAAITLSKLAAVTASRVLVSDASGVISASSVTSTTLGYLDATSSIQTQLNGKEPTISNLPVSKGGTGSTTALNNNRIMQSSGGNIVEAAAITAARVLISDTNGIPTHSNVTDTTLSYLDATSSIQTQLNGKEPTISTLSIAKGGTNSSTALTNDRVMISNGGKIVESSTTTTTLGYLDATSSIQTQLNAKAPLISPSLTTPDIGAAKGASLVLAASSPTLNGSAILQADSTTKGFLPPRMTQAQRDAISTPATGLEVYNTDTNKLNIYNGTSWGEVGSGSSGINYITDTDGTVLGSWVTYADAAGSSPVDGTGGSANVTFVTSSNSDLRGTTNFLFSHDAVNRQGQGFSYNFTIDKADQAKMLQIRFDYLVSSGTYADGDLTVWVYDVTNAALIQPAPYKILNAVSAQSWIGEFQTASNSTSYRLIFHVTTTTATAYTMRFDAFSVNPQANRAYGTPVTDWVSYTPTWTATTSNPSIGNGTITGKWARVGDSGYYQIKIVTGSTTTFGSGTYKFSIPSGQNIDYQKQTFSGASDDSTVPGDGLLLQSGVNRWQFRVVNLNNFSANEFALIYQKNEATTSIVYSNTGFGHNTPVTLSGAGNIISINIGPIPISGWSSNTVMSSDAATNVVAMSAYGSTTTINNTSPTIVFPTVSFDTTNSYNSSTGVLTVTVPGKYRISSMVLTGSSVSWSLNNFVELSAYVNTTYYTLDQRRCPAAASYQMSASGSRDFDLKAGDTVAIKAYSDVSVALDSKSYFSIERISGPAQIAATDTVAASYRTSAATTISTATDIPFGSGTKIYDTNGIYSASTVTFPISGKYKIKVILTTAAASFAATTYFETTVVQSGSVSRTYTIDRRYGNGSSINLVNNGSVDIQALAGDTVKIQGALSTGSVNLVGNEQYCHIEIVKVGNY